MENDLNHSDSRDTKFQEWALVELMGHQRIAGKVSEQAIGGGVFLRVDVPDREGNTRFTRFYGAPAIYCISPVDRQIAIGLAVKMEVEPVHRFQLQDLAGTRERSLNYEPHPDDSEGL